MSRVTLTDFLLARIAEDEAAAERSSDHPDPTAYARDDYGHLWVQPARVLAECEAKRRIVALWAEEWPEWHGDGSGLVRTRMTDDQFARVRTAELVLCHLALPYADHPDYDEEWKP